MKNYYEEPATVDNLGTGEKVYIHSGVFRGKFAIVSRIFDKTDLVSLKLDKGIYPPNDTYLYSIDYLNILREIKEENKEKINMYRPNAPWR